MWEQTKEIAAAKNSKYFEIFPLRTKGKIWKQEMMKNKDIGKKTYNFKVTMKIDKEFRLLYA